VGPRPPARRGLSRWGGRAPGPHAAHVAQWLWWLRERSAEYRAQPYEALAAAYGGAGYDDLARRILVAQRDDVRDRGSLSPVRRLGQYCAKWLTGYGYHCFYAFLWLAGLFTVTALVAVFWLGPQKYIVPGPAAGATAIAAARVSGSAGSARPAASPAGTAPASAPAASAALAASASPSAAASPPASARPSAPAPSAATASPSAATASPSAPAPSASPTARAPAGPGRAATVPSTRPCSDPARVGYAIGLAFPLINLNSSAGGQCDVPATGAAAGVVVFGWAVRAAAASLLALYTLGLTGVTRSPPGAG